MTNKILLAADIVSVIFTLLAAEVANASNASLIRLQARLWGSTPASERTHNIVVVGASFAGHHAAKVIASQLPRDSKYRVIVIEPNSHFQFTWVLPRFCVAPGHDEKAFIPYGKYVNAVDGALCWVRGRVAAVSENAVTLEGSGEEIPYSYLVIATGSGVPEGLPSRVNCVDRDEGIQALKDIQQHIKDAENLVVVGGGAAGVEVATDAKHVYPDKKVTLVHSRGTVMHRFGTELQEEAAKGLERLGVEVILNDRAASDAEDGHVTLKSGKEIPCDYLVKCIGQKPNSHILEDISSSAISDSGYIKVLPTLQIADKTHSHIYAIGDVAETNVPMPNARSARQQASIAARNIISSVKGQSPSTFYKYHWMEGFIKLTLGLDRSVSYFGHSDSSFLFKAKEKKEELMAAQCWSMVGQKAYRDAPNPYLRESPLPGL